MDEEIWYMDCYSFHAACGDLFPVHSYHGNDLEYLMKKGKELLERDSSGVDKVSFARTSDGCNPIEIEQEIEP
jgi:hypothetical protein